MSAEDLSISVKIPEKVRVSLGSAIVLGLLDGKLDAAPTTAYLMTYKDGKCLANCGFCPQARQSRSRADMLSRISWPVFATAEAFSKTEMATKNGKIKRVCIQALKYPEVFTHLKAIVETIFQNVKVPISVSCQPLNFENIKCLKEAGAERIGIPIDAATERIFDKVKGPAAGGPYSMKRQIALLEEAVKVFGKGRVSTHLIVGLGETEMEMAHMIQRCVDMGVLPALFAFTPVSGTVLEHCKQPPIHQYRKVQMARYLIFKGLSKFENMIFDGEGRIVSFGVAEQTLKRIIQSGEPFMTSGCPDCNRPYYNEKPSGPIYNYPKVPSMEELQKVAEELKLV